MKKGPKIIQISGIKGLFLVAFTIICLGAGFIVFPAKVAMTMWNYAVSTYFTAVPTISLWQGILLWAFTALSVYLLNHKKAPIEFKQPMELSDEEMQVLMNRIRMQKQAQKLNAMLLKANEIKVIKKEEESVKEEENNQTSNNVNEKHS